MQGSTSLKNASKRKKNHDNRDLVVEFNVTLTEFESDPGAEFAQAIRGRLLIFDDSLGERVEVGRISADLFNIAFVDPDELFDWYDSRDGHLLNALELIYDFGERDFRPKVLSLPDISDLIDWHLHIDRIDVQEEYRGRGLALRAMRQLQRLVQRPGLIVTLKAFPSTESKKEDPSSKAIASLARYYKSDAALRFKPIERLSDGWLMGDWC